MPSFVRLTSFALLGALPIAAATSCKSSSGAAPDQTAVLPTLPSVAAQTGAPRLTKAQYQASIHDVFGADIVVTSAIEPDVVLNGFAAIGASAATISARGVEQYEASALDVAKQVMTSPTHAATIMTCQPAGLDDAACAKTIFAALGRSVWRRPLTDAEATAIAGVVVKASTKLSDYGKGVQYGIATLLQSPNFLFRGNVGEPDPTQVGQRRYTSWEMASRLSYFLWNSTPDEELLAAAAHGDLVTDDGVAAQAARLLASPRAHAGLREFVTEYLGLDKLDALTKDANIYTQYSPDIGKSMREETLRVFEHIAFDLDGDFRDVFTTRQTFVNPPLAALYQIEAPDPSGFGPVTLPDDGPRAGILGHASFLALYAHPTSSSATIRGELVRKTLLCGVVNPPPVNVNTSLAPPTSTAATLRDRVKVHLTDPGCAACHKLMDPIGLGFEQFDGIGVFRTKDNGAVIDPSGDVDGTKYVDGRDMGRVLHDHPSVPRCFTRNAYRFATGFVETDAEKDTIDALTARFVASGHRIQGLMLALAESPAFRLARAPQ